MTDIPELQRLHDIDADQPVKFTRILRSRIKSGEYRQGDILPAADLAHEHNALIRVIYRALAMLAANQYVSCPGALTSHSVIWQAET